MTTLTNLLLLTIVILVIIIILVLVYNTRKQSLYLFVKESLYNKIERYELTKQIMLDYDMNFIDASISIDKAEDEDYEYFKKLENGN